jgi:hypothetical protein
METNIRLRKLEFHRHMALLVGNRRCSRIPRPSIVTAPIWTSCRSPASPVAAPLVRLSLNVSSFYPAVSLKRDMSRYDKLNTAPRLPPKCAVYSLGMCLIRAVCAGYDPHRRSLDHLPKLTPVIRYYRPGTSKRSTPRDSFVCFSPRRHRFVRRTLCLSSSGEASAPQHQVEHCVNSVCRVVVLRGHWRVQGQIKNERMGLLPSS